MSGTASLLFSLFLEFALFILLVARVNCWTNGQVLEAGKLLHIKEHEVFDGSGNAVKMAAPVECKGIVGSDDRSVCPFNAHL